MRSDEMARMAIRTRLFQVLVVFAAAACLDLALILWGAASAPPVSLARADVRSDMPRAPAEPAATEPRAGPAPIREAHADGGYWYWLERRAAGGI